jgi:hypothetical protein
MSEVSVRDETRIARAFMTRRRIGLAGIALLMVAIGVWVALPKHGSSSGSVASRTVTEIPVHASEVPGSFAAIRSVDRPSRSASTSVSRQAPSAKSIADAEEPVIDRDFAAAAARPYVEMYQREHPGFEIGRFDWTQFKVIYAKALEHCVGGGAGSADDDQFGMLPGFVETDGVRPGRVAVIFEHIDAMPTNFVDICGYDFTQVISSESLGLAHGDALAQG